MIKTKEKQILDNLQGIPYPIKRAEFTCGTLYLELDEENQCDLVHEAIRNHYIENINLHFSTNIDDEIFISWDKTKENSLV